MHLVHFGTLDVWYTCRYTTPLVTVSVSSTFGTFGTVFTFSTPVAFGTLSIVSVFSTLDIIPSECRYICGTFVHFTLYKL